MTIDPTPTVADLEDSADPAAPHSRRDLLALAGALAMFAVPAGAATPAAALAAGAATGAAAGTSTAPPAAPPRGLPIRGIRITTLPDGESHVEEYEMPFMEATGPIAAWEKADYFKLMSFPASFSTGWHRAGKQPKLVILLRGHSVIFGSDGSSAELKPGMFMLAEDTTGRGHSGRVLSPDGSATLEIGITMPRAPYQG